MSKYVWWLLTTDVFLISNTYTRLFSQRGTQSLSGVFLAVDCIPHLISNKTNTWILFVYFNLPHYSAMLLPLKMWGNFNFNCLSFRRLLLLIRNRSEKTLFVKMYLVLGDSEWSLVNVLWRMTRFLVAKPILIGSFDHCINFSPYININIIFFTVCVSIYYIPTFGCFIKNCFSIFFPEGGVNKPFWFIHTKTEKLTTYDSEGLLESIMYIFYISL